MATIVGSNGGTVIAGTEASDVIYGYDLNVGAIPATLVAGNFSSPVFAASAPGDPGRLHVVEKDAGRIVILDLQSGARSTFLDIPDTELSSGGEQGLLSVAFHPGYASNGLFYVNFVNANGDVEVRSYTRSASSPDAADPASGRTVLVVPHPTHANHNGGTLAFGPDGYLYVSIGDGGSGDDPAENAERVDTLLGKMLRLDVNRDDFPADAAANYGIPPDNPFVGQAGARGEIWAYGLRNPWRFSFDANGDLYIGDVGQDQREEIDFQPAGSPGGIHYGWDIKEGTLINEGSVVPGLVDPIFEYGRDQGRSVTGGYVYHGAAPALQGGYVFTDFFATNQIQVLRVVDGQVAHHARLPVSVTGGGTLGQIASFGIDGNGALYAVSLAGGLHRLDFPVTSDGHDTILAGGGHDTIFAGPGNDIVDGGAGLDTLAVGEASARYTAVTYAGTIALFTNATAEHDRATGVERLKFADVTVDAGAISAFADFDYLASYVDLILAFGPNGQSAFDHYVNHGFAEGRARDAFDNFDYLASYGDLIAAFGANQQAAAQHFVTWGFNEGRARDAFDNLDYLASYNDLIAAFGPNPQAAAQHFVTWGFNEGRARDAFANFDYLASYDDLITAFGPNPQLAAQHYIVWGFGEGRARDAFDNFQYIASYGDLIEAFGVNAQAAAHHYVGWGFHEGRVRDSFNAEQYLANYPDLQAAFGSDTQAATIHFIQHGYGERRTDEPLT